jgi:hypothetical protein
MKALLSLSLASVLLAPALAHASQCELVSDEVATRALAVLADHPEVIRFCEPCSDAAPGEPHRLDHLAKQRGTDPGDDYAVTIDKREVDLAYIYVRMSPARYENLAALAGCVTSGVSPELIVSDASDRGVMITPGVPPLIPRSDTAPLAAPRSAVTYVIGNADRGWLFAGVGFGSSAIGALTTLVILRRRRVRAMRPRALHLSDRS